MAVTQQLAYLPESVLYKCLHCKCDLDRLLSFTLLDEKCYADLGWDCSYLRTLIARYKTDYLTNYSDAIDGIHEFPESLGEQNVEEQPKYNRIEDVEEIYRSLKDIDAVRLLSVLPTNPAEINCLLGSDYDETPLIYLSNALNRLIEFYKMAFESKSCIVCWWD